MHGAKRVIIFCLLATILPISLVIIPLYLRHNLYADVVYVVTESDVLEISDGISTIFCSAQTLEMNGTFNAFQMNHKPEIASSRKHLRLKKSMILPDDTLEYWGFYLLRGATVILSVCSRFPGASILVVKGEKTLRTCGMLDHNKNKARTTGIFLPHANDQVKITFEDDAREIESEESATSTPSSTLPSLPKTLSNFTNKYIEDIIKARMELNATRKLRHAQKRGKNHQARLPKNIKGQRSKTKSKMSNKQNYQNTLELLKNLNSLDINAAGEEDDKGLKVFNSHHHRRVKRNQGAVKPPALLDQGIQHGGNALRNFTDDEDSSVSSFEEGLLNCYGGQVLLQQEFEPSDLCINVSYLETAKHMQSKHSIMEDGYYYYIFYSDNDFVYNDIHAVFNIYKPTFQYENFVHRCVNKTTCTFPLTVLSSDRVIVEMPTKDGIDRQEDDIHMLISVCHPRMGIYIIFPIAVLFSIIVCAFL